MVGQIVDRVEVLRLKIFRASILYCMSSYLSRESVDGDCDGNAVIEYDR